MSVLLVVTVGGVHVGAAVVARHRAQAAADLAALSAATVLPAGLAAACGYAERVAGAMGTAATSCAVEGLDVVVTVEAPVGLTLVGRPASAAARAGPATSPT